MCKVLILTIICTHATRLRCLSAVHVHAVPQLSVRVSCHISQPFNIQTLALIARRSPNTGSFQASLIRINTFV